VLTDAKKQILRVAQDDKLKQRASLAMTAYMSVLSFAGLLTR
jgi:hypothetical protein